MKKVSLILLALGLWAMVVPATQAADKAARAEKKAQKNVFATYDKNSNNSLEADEVAAIKKAIDTDPALKQYDTNGDGKLDDNEIAGIKGPKQAKKKKAK